MGNICNHKKFYDEKDEEDDVYDKLIKEDYKVSIFDDNNEIKVIDIEELKFSNEYPCLVTKLDELLKIKDNVKIEYSKLQKIDEI